MWPPASSSAVARRRPLYPDGSDGLCRCADGSSAACLSIASVVVAGAPPRPPAPRGGRAGGRARPGLAGPPTRQRGYAFVGGVPAKHDPAERDQRGQATDGHRGAAAVAAEEAGLVRRNGRVGVDALTV